MRFVGLVTVFVLSFCIFHFAMNGIGQFVTLEVNYFNIWEWQSASRFIWLFFGSIFSFFCVVVTAQATCD